MSSSFLPPSPPSPSPPLPFYRSRRTDEPLSIFPPDLPIPPATTFSRTVYSTSNLSSPRSLPSSQPFPLLLPRRLRPPRSSPHLSPTRYKHNRIPTSSHDSTSHSHRSSISSGFQVSFPSFFVRLATHGRLLTRFSASSLPSFVRLPEVFVILARAICWKQRHHLLDDDDGDPGGSGISVMRAPKPQALPSRRRPPGSSDSDETDSEDEDSSTPKKTLDWKRLGGLLVLSP